MFMHKMFALFLSLALGYVLCILAKKEKGALKTLGYTLGISILVLSLGYALAVSYLKTPMGMYKMCGKMSKVCGTENCPMMKK